MPGRGCECGDCSTCLERAYRKDYFLRKGPAWVAERKRQDKELHRRKNRANPEHQRALSRAFYRRHAEEIAARNLVSRSKERDRAVARTQVSRAIRDGLLVRGECEVGEDCFGAIEAHHDDYARPLDVRWICKSHHMRMHKDAE